MSITVPVERATRRTAASRLRSVLSADGAIVSAIVLLQLLLHVGSLHLDVFGEPDAARLAIDGAWIWANDEPFMQSYRTRSSPLYIAAVATALEASVLHVSDVPAALTLLSLASSVAILVFLYFLLGVWIDRRLIRGCLCLLLAAAPSFWLMSNYGFPTLVAGAFYMAALAGYRQWVVRGRKGFFLLACLAWLIAVGLKFDVVFMGFGFLIVELGIRMPGGQRPSLRKLLALLPPHLLLAGLAVAAFLAFPHLLGDHVTEVSGDVGAWDETWPMYLTPYGLARHLARAVQASGVGTVLAMLAAAVVALRRRPDLLVQGALWGLPLVAFWILREGGARHYVLPAVGGLLLLGWALTHLRQDRVVVLVCVLVLALNYLPFRASADTLRPSGRVLASARLHLEESRIRHARATAADAAADAAAVRIPHDELAPYYVWEFIVRLDDPERSLEKLKPSPRDVVVEGMARGVRRQLWLEPAAR